MPSFKAEIPFIGKMRLYMGTDDFGLLLPFVVLRCVLGLAIAAVALAIGGCNTDTMLFLCVMMGIMAVRGSMAAYTAGICLQGPILDTAARAHAAPFLSALILLRVVDVGVSIWGIQVAWTQTDECDNYNVLWFILIFCTVNFLLTAATLVMMFCVTRRCANCWCMAAGKLILACFPSGVDHDMIETITTLLMEFTAGFDLTFTDVLAGLVLIWTNHKIHRGLLELEQEKRRSDAGGRAALASTVPLDTLDDIEWATYIAVGIYGWVLHVHRRSEPYMFLPILCYTCGLVRPRCCCCQVGPEKWAEADQSKGWACLQMNRHALRIAIDESLGGPLPSGVDTAGGAADSSPAETKADVEAPAPPSTPPPSGPPPEAVVVWAKWQNSIADNSHPYAVVIDHRKRAVVLAVRGTLSLADAFIDLHCVEEKVTLDGGRDGGLAHVGMLRAAQLILRELGETFPGPSTKEQASAGVDERPAGVLTSLMKGQAPFPSVAQREPSIGFAACASYQLVLTGHSLGAGIAGILAVLCRDRWGERVRAVLLAPPGGLLSLDAAKATEDYTVSAAYDYDMIWRLSRRTMELLRDQCVAELSTCRQPKLSVLLSALTLVRYSARDLAMGSALAQDTVSGMMDTNTEISMLAKIRSASVKWPSQNETVSTEAWALVKHFTAVHSCRWSATEMDGQGQPLADGRHRARPMYPPGQLVELSRATSPSALCVGKCCCWVRPCACKRPDEHAHGVRAEFVHRDALQHLVVSIPFMMTDHLPNHLLDALQLHRRTHSLGGRRAPPAEPGTLTSQPTGDEPHAEGRVRAPSGLSDPAPSPPPGMASINMDPPAKAKSS